MRYEDLFEEELSYKDNGLSPLLKRAQATGSVVIIRGRWRNHRPNMSAHNYCPGLEETYDAFLSSPYA